MLTAPCGWTQAGCPDCPDFDGLPATQQDLVADAAADLLWRATGRVYGDCSVSVRLCTDDCRHHAVCQAVEGSAVVVHSGGCGGCDGGCGCGVESQATLTGPVASVEEVREDGVALDPSAYRVDEYAYLVRTDGGRWPSDGSVEVDYTMGHPLPPSGQLALRVLTCELAKLCSGDAKCRLPRNWSQITRQGVTVSKSVDPVEMIRDGLTGLWEVDMWTQSLRNQPPIMSVTSPSVKTPRMQTWP